AARLARTTSSSSMISSVALGLCMFLPGGIRQDDWPECGLRAGRGSWVRFKAQTVLPYERRFKPSTPATSPPLPMALSPAIRSVVDIWKGPAYDSERPGLQREARLHSHARRQRRSVARWRATDRRHVRRSVEHGYAGGRAHQLKDGRQVASIDSLGAPHAQGPGRRDRGGAHQHARRRPAKPGAGDPRNTLSAESGSAITLRIPPPRLAPPLRARAARRSEVVLNLPVQCAELAILQVGV